MKKLATLSEKPHDTRLYYDSARDSLDHKIYGAVRARAGKAGLRYAADVLAYEPPLAGVRGL